MKTSTRLVLCAGLALATLVASAAIAAATRPEAGLVPLEQLGQAAISRVSRPAKVELPAPGRELGSFQLTYYWMASEGKRPRVAADGEGPPAVALKTKNCKAIATVSASFSRRLRLEGSGRLRDGRVVSTAGHCRCGAPCYHVARASQPWGTGVNERPLSPFRSVAVDSSLVSIGSVLYIPALDGMTMPGRAPWGGFVHDGCVIADDRGGGVRGKQLDLFTARRAHYQALARRLAQKKVTVLDGTERCRDSAKRVTVARRGGV
jgi:3D (Asp-Asp-Asp) domain-containing protein